MKYSRLHLGLHPHPCIKYGAGSKLQQPVRPEPVEGSLSKDTNPFILGLTNPFVLSLSKDTNPFILGLTNPFVLSLSKDTNPFILSLSKGACRRTAS